jgi:hypothetical protein
MITGDPRAFGAAMQPPSPGPPARSTSRVVLALGAVAVVALMLSLAWPRSSHSTLTATTTTVPVTVVTTPIVTTPIVTTPPPTTLPGREAPTLITDSHIGLSVEPATAALRQYVTVRLSGDLVSVLPAVAAVVWIDQSVADQWRTIAWFALVADDAQISGFVSADGAGPGPDAIFLPPAAGLEFNVDRLKTGTYRVCRYVPVHATDSSTVPGENPIYVCGPMIIDHDSTTKPPTT